MKKIFFALAAVALVSCAQPELRHPKFAYDATIYELNTRQLTEEGTFAAAEALLPQLRENGIDIIWVMPCQPIGKITRKGTLGSYYSIIDYSARVRTLSISSRQRTNSVSRSSSTG